MKIKWGALVVDGRNKIGGHVASKNRAGAYLRTKVTPANPNTSYQAESRNRLSTIATAWTVLVSASVLAWNTAVEAFKGTDIFGDIRNPSGFNLYQRLNNNLVRMGQSMIQLPPVPVSLPEIKTGILTAVHAGAIKVTFSADPLMTATEIQVDATPAISQGKSFVKSEFRMIGIAPAIVTHEMILTTEYGNKFGAVGAAGKKIFVRLSQISKTTGQKGISVIYAATIS